MPSEWVERHTYSYQYGPLEWAEDSPFIDNRDFFYGNCQLFVHRVYEELLGIRLPPELRSQELFEDTELFECVPGEKSVLAGDIFFFGKELAFIDKRKLHLAIASGEKTEEGEELLLHISDRAGICMDAVSHLLDMKRYKFLFGRKRYKSIGI